MHLKKLYPKAKTGRISFRNLIDLFAKYLYVVSILLTCGSISFCQNFAKLETSLDLESSEADVKEPEIRIFFHCEEFKETKRIPTSLYGKQDLLTLLAELSKKEDPQLRFISTNTTEEIMEVNGQRNTWKEGWVIYVNEEKISSKALKKGIRVGVEDQIQIRFEAVERVFGRPKE
ncbi:MAG: hypothetical protein O9301_11100 [Leptospira sp.]|nr:hypothetical protein [Leptospira sp.]